MIIEINNKEYEVIINKKRTTKNLYIRVKEDLKIYVTCNIFTTDKSIKDLINKNIDFIEKTINKYKEREIKNKKFYYLGKEYNINYKNIKDIEFYDDDVFYRDDFNLDKFYKEECKIIFKERLDHIYKNFPYDIPKPSLCVRTMKTRWGVCNTKLKKVTLNQELIKKDIVFLDYVIVHELCHLLHANHSKSFWECVYKVMPEAKKIRKELRENA